MTPQETKQLKSLLIKEKEALEAELGRIASLNPNIKGDYQTRFQKPEPGDTLDEKAHSVTDYEKERAVEQSLELRLREIDDTLKKVDEGTYGVCDKCRSSIGERRLKVIPVAKLCLECAKKARLI